MRYIDSSQRDGFHHFSPLSLHISFISALSLFWSPLFLPAAFSSHSSVYHSSDLGPHIFMTSPLRFLQLNELVSALYFLIPGRQKMICFMISPTGAKRPSLLQPGGDDAVFSTGVAIPRRFPPLQQHWPSCWLKRFYFIYVYILFVYIKCQHIS